MNQVLTELCSARAPCLAQARAQHRGSCYASSAGHALSSPGASLLQHRHVWGQQACPHRAGALCKCAVTGPGECAHGHARAASGAQHCVGRRASGGPSTGPGSTALAEASSPVPAAGTEAEQGPGRTRGRALTSHTSYGRRGSSVLRHTRKGRAPGRHDQRHGPARSPSASGAGPSLSPPGSERHPPERHTEESY